MKITKIETELQPDGTWVLVFRSNWRKVYQEVNFNSAKTALEIGTHVLERFEDLTKPLEAYEGHGEAE